jgi:integrase/recombinase XerD
MRSVGLCGVAARLAGWAWFGSPVCGWRCQLLRIILGPFFARLGRKAGVVLEKVFHRAAVRARIDSNPSGPILREYVAFLAARGHPPGPLHQYVFAVEHFGRWAVDKPIDGAAVERFVKVHLPRCRCPKAGSPSSSVYPSGAAPPSGDAPLERAAVGTGATANLLGAYEDHLRLVCGLSAATIFYRLRYARDLMHGLAVRHIGALRAWSADRISSYVSKAGARCQPSSGQVLASSLRSFLRFLRFRGLIQRDLAGAVPSFANWRLASLPESVGPDALERLVLAADASSPVGMRDRAVLLCMTELGLRAADVAAIDVDGIDLARRIVSFRRPKQRDQVELPMTQKLTSAIGLYLRRGRPLCRSSALFTKHRAPLGTRLKAIGIRGIAVRRAEDVGLGDRIRGTHVIRHSVATALINAGAPMKQIADLLGHRSIDTTAIYAKVDSRSLRRVPLPWPTADSGKVWR